MNLSRATYNIKSENLNLYMWIVLGGLMAFTSLSVDIYLPAMPAMHQELEGDIELTITGFLIGFSIAQLIWGPISDTYGRRLPLVLGLVLYIIGSIGCALSNSVFAIVFWRVIQAFGACVGPMLSRAMIRDMFSKTKAAEKLSTLIIIMAIAPIAGPVLGGQIIKISTWHSIFWLLAGIGAIMLIALIWLPETLEIERRQKASIKRAFVVYGQLLKERKFMSYCLCVTFFYVAAYAFIAGSPKVYINYFGVQPQWYGWLFAVNVIGLVGISFANRKLVKKYSLHQLLKVSTLIATLAGIILVGMVSFNIGGFFGVLIPVFFFFSMNGIIAACATAAALDDVPNTAGAAAALLGALQYGSGILSTLLLAFFSDDTPQTMCWIIGIFTAASAIVILVLPTRYKK